MNTTTAPVRHSVQRTFAGLCAAMLGLALAGCSTAESTAPAGSPSSAASAQTPVAVEEAADITATETPAPAQQPSTAPAGRLVHLHVEGAKANALVKTLVVTSTGKESGGEMRNVALPYDKDLTLPAGTTFTKVLVLGKYASGATGNISCTVTIDGKEVASKSSSNHQPAECLFLEKGAK